jgi:pyrroline-5-carboxylate reductase
MQSFPDKVIAFIGGGNMASSIIGGLVSSGWPASMIRVSDPVDSQRENLSQKFGVQCYEDNQLCIESADVVILAVKPQMLRQVVTPISSSLQDSTPLIISIVAGISSRDTMDWIGVNLPFIRVMPNTPALVNRGVSGLYATSSTSDSQRELAATLMKSVGEVVWVSQESLIDTVTGVSGSGPAYFFKLMELMIAEAEANGLDAESAQTLVVETAAGAAALMQQSALRPAELRRQVTSPGGTTNAGIQFMEQAGIEQAVRGGVRAAVLRSAELAEEFGGS